MTKQDYTRKEVCADCLRQTLNFLGLGPKYMQQIYGPPKVDVAEWTKAFPPNGVRVCAVEIPEQPSEAEITCAATQLAREIEKYPKFWTVKLPIYMDSINLTDHSSGLSFRLSERGNITWIETAIMER